MGSIIFVLTIDIVGCWSRKLGNLSRVPGHPTPSLAGSPRLGWCDLDSRKDCPGTALCCRPPLPVKQRIFGRSRLQPTATLHRPGRGVITQGLANRLRGRGCWHTCAYLRERQVQSVPPFPGTSPPAFPPVLAQVALSSAQGQAMGAIPSSGLAPTHPAHPCSHPRNLTLTPKFSFLTS